MAHSAKKLIDNLGALARTGWLANQPADFQSRIARFGRWAKLRPRQSLYCAGEPAMALFGLESGALDVAVSIDEGEEVQVHRAQAGAWVGERALLNDTTYRCSVWAAVECRVFLVPGAAIQQNLQQHPQDTASFFALSMSQAVVTRRVLAEILALPTGVRFARLILRLAEPDGTVRATQDELGRMAGMSRNAFRRSCAGLISSGAVQMHYGGLRVINSDALRRSAKLV